MSVPSAFRYVSPDQVAECLEGVSSVDGLDLALWALVENHARPYSEVPEPVEFCWWSELSPVHQSALIELAAADPCWD